MPETWPRNTVCSTTLFMEIEIGNISIFQSITVLCKLLSVSFDFTSTMQSFKSQIYHIIHSCFGTFFENSTTCHGEIALRLPISVKQTMSYQIIDR